MENSVLVTRHFWFYSSPRFHGHSGGKTRPTPDPRQDQLRPSCPKQHRMSSLSHSPVLLWRLIKCTCTCTVCFQYASAENCLVIITGPNMVIKKEQTKYFLLFFFNDWLCAERQVDVPASDRAAADHGAGRVVCACAVRRLPPVRPSVLAHRFRRRHRDELVVPSPSRWVRRPRVLCFVFTCLINVRWLLADEGDQLHHAQHDVQLARDHRRTGSRWVAHVFKHSAWNYRKPQCGGERCRNERARRCGLVSRDLRVPPQHQSTSLSTMSQSM